MSKIFYISAPVNGTAFIEIQASSKEEATKKAFESPWHGAAGAGYGQCAKGEWGFDPHECSLDERMEKWGVDAEIVAKGQDDDT